MWRCSILQYSPRRGQRKKCTLAMEIRLRSCLASRFCIVAVLSLKIAHFRQHFPSNRIIHYSLFSNHLARGARVLALDPRLSALDFGCGSVVYFLLNGLVLEIDAGGKCKNLFSPSRSCCSWAPQKLRPRKTSSKIPALKNNQRQRDSQAAVGGCSSEKALPNSEKTVSALIAAKVRRGLRPRPRQNQRSSARL